MFHLFKILLFFNLIFFNHWYISRRLIMAKSISTSYIDQSQNPSCFLLLVCIGERTLKRFWLLILYESIKLPFMESQAMKRVIMLKNKLKFMIVVIIALNFIMHEKYSITKWCLSLHELSPQTKCKGSIYQII